MNSNQESTMNEFEAITDLFKLFQLQDKVNKTFLARFDNLEKRIKELEDDMVQRKQDESIGLR